MSLSAWTVVKGDAVTKRIQLKEDGAAKDITGHTFKLGVKEGIADASYRIGPVDGAIDDAAAGKVSFALSGAETGQAGFRGVYEIAMYDGSGKRTTLTQARGVEFRLVENIID